MDSLTEIYLTQVANAASENINESSSKIITGSKQRKQSKRVAMYEIRKSSKDQGIPLAVAYNQYMRRSHLPGDIKRDVFFALDLGSFAKRNEEYIPENSPDQEYDVQVVSRSTDGKTRKYTRKASEDEIKQLQKNPKIQSIEKISKLDPVGKEDEDINNDGKFNNVDRYLLNRRDKRSDAIKSQKVGESFSNWREDLKEIVDMEKVEKHHKNDKKFVEHEGTNKIIIHPELSKEEFNLLEMYEIDESNDLFVEFIYNVAESFYTQGYDEDDINYLSESLSSDEFMNLLSDMNEQFLTEARAGGVRVEPVTKDGKSVGSLKRGKTSAINRLRKEKAARRSAENAASAAKPSGLTAALKSQSASANKPKAKTSSPPTSTATSSASKKKSALDRIAGAVLKGIERHKKATATAGRLARETGETIKKAASVGSKGAKAFGSGVASGVRDTATAAKKTKKAFEEYDLDEMKMPKMKEVQKGVGERIVSGFRRHSQAMADLKQNREIKKREKTIPRAALMASFSPEECEIIESIMNKNLQEKAPPGENYKRMVKHIKKKYSKNGLTKKEKSIAYATAWKAKNKNVEEAVSDINTNIDDKVRKSQAEAERKQQLANQKRLIDRQRMLQMQRLQLQKQGRLPMGHTMEGVEKNSAFDIVKQKMINKHGKSAIVGTPEYNKTRDKDNKKNPRKVHMPKSDDGWEWK